MAYKILEFDIKGDHAGKLIALEEGRDFPFNIQRVYYIWGTNRDSIRGRHAHHNLEQVVVCISGSCDFLLDDGKTRTTIHLNTPSKGLYLSGCIWREFTNFSEDCTIMVLASQPYDPSDYIHDYETFKKVANRA